MSGQNTLTSREELDNWVSVFAGEGKETPGIKTHTDAKLGVTSIYTSVAFVELGSGSNKQKLECRAIHATVSGYGSMYLLGFRAISNDHNFSKRRSSMTAVADKQAISLGTPRGFFAQASIGVAEIMFFRVSRASLKKIANASTVELRINGLKGELTAETRDLFRQLLNGTE
jgi:hypothetical protein